ncbi:phosphatidate cytidylyltransferase [Lachnotalea glycerini]|uniref:Phosphatidate cytidylyltransferase n=1 Tax=Lachnotalea glycerini TaxID=1763509 RepID=A0A255I5D3_9FIRM|nr:phosphatidate cytidylyltransferase [Lachnotalea glycerini]PXV93545.1 phosphatidate cytidylyltransferase [Lachnotalea glycerini]RDY32505.1 phosphatidate cytidylyltransferase [Lachnotalea glycerini]
MFKTRLLSGIILVILALFTLIQGGDILFATTLIISLIGLSEIYKVVKINNNLIGFIGYIAAICYYFLLRFELKIHLMQLIMGFLIFLMTAYVFSFPKYRVEQIMTTFFGLFYVAIMLSYIYQTRILQDGAYIVWLIFICSWGCDTCAYCVGMLFGKHKMAPRLSPKKSIEGAVGGVLGAAVIGVIYASIINNYLISKHDVIAGYAVICSIGAMISQIGDLAASAIKRNHDIKDYGRLIPGHGGILDRFDSVIFTAPVIYFLATSIL